MGGPDARAIEAARAALARDGHARLGRVDAAAVAAARAAADGVLAAHGARSAHGAIAIDAWRREPAFAALAAPVAAALRALTGAPALVLFQDLVIDKRGDAPRELPWHQDQAYLPLDRDDGVVAWVALDDVPVGRGALRYVPGSHRLGARRPGAFDGAPADPVDPRPPIDVAGRAIVDAPAQAGELLVHGTLTWHMSPPNPTARPRRAWSAWFVDPATRWAPARAAHPLLVELAPAAGDPLDPARFPRW